MIKFLDILKESDDNIFIPRGSKEEKDKIFIRRTNDKIQEYIKDDENLFCRNTGLSDFLGNFDNLLLLYNEHELCSAAAVSFVYNDTEDKIIGIHIPFFCSKIKGYGSLLLQQIMSLCKSHKWFIGLNPIENSHEFYVKNGFRKIDDLYYYNL